MNTQELELKLLQQDPSTMMGRYVRTPFTWFFGWGMAGLRYAFTEDIQLTGLENLVTENGAPLKGPLLWLVKHESWFDFVNYPAIIPDLPEVPLFKGAARNDYAPWRWLNGVVNTLMKLMFFQLHRIEMKEGLSEEERALLRQGNERILAQVRDDYARGYHAAIAPEGTTKTDGRISKIRSGAYELCVVGQSTGEHNGERRAIRCIPLGNTYDFLAGDTLFGRKRNLVFFNIGEPFQYQPVEREPGESDEDYTRRDRYHFLDQIHERFMQLNTLTTSQLGGLYLYNQLRDHHEGTSVKSVCTLEELGTAIEQMLAAVCSVSSVSDIFVDNALLNASSHEKRIRRFYDALVSQGYLVPDGDHTYLNRERMLHVPASVKEYKQGNILLYSVNRLDEILQHRPEIRDALGPRYRRERMG